MAAALFAMKAKWNAESIQDLKHELGVMRAAAVRIKISSYSDGGQPDGNAAGVAESIVLVLLQVCFVKKKAKVDSVLDSKSFGLT